MPSSLAHPPHLTVLIGGPDNSANRRALAQAYLDSPVFGTILAWFPADSTARELLAPGELAESESLAAQAGLWADVFTVL